MNKQVVKILTKWGIYVGSKKDSVGGAMAEELSTLGKGGKE